MAISPEKWCELLQETATYLDVLHRGGFCCVDGTFESLRPKQKHRPTPKPSPRGAARHRESRQTLLTGRERDRLKAELMDPHAHLAPLAAAASSSPSTPSQGRSSGARKHGRLELRDRDDGLRRIKAARSLDEIRTLVAGCYMCGLAAGRTNTVPGEGNSAADLVFVGEAPGYNEDRQGRPFVGRAGDLLTEMIRAMGLRREDVFICNIIKCRPPSNRDPGPREIAACEPFLRRQLELLQPKVICALGRIAIQSLLRNTQPISKVRGKWQVCNGIPLMPTYHPAYLLRSPAQKRVALDDLRAIMAKMKELTAAD